MNKSLDTLIFLVPLAIPYCGLAQSTEDFHLYTLNVGAGYSAVAGQDGSNLTGEWNVEGGAGFCFLKKNRWGVFVDFDYLYDRTQVKQSALIQAKNLNPTNVALLNATGGASNFNVVAFDPTVRICSGSHKCVYFFGGFGYFRRQIDLTGVANQGSLLEPTSPATFLRDTSSGSVDGGGGVQFNGKGWWRPYFEVRVVHGLAANHSTTIVPFGAGLRW